jgi:hypothetical protein
MLTKPGYDVRTCNTLRKLLALQVLDGLGLGPHGPPIPPPASFAVVPYPVRRRPPLGSDPSSHYAFVASGPDDPNALQEEKSKEPDPEVEKNSDRAQVYQHTKKGLSHVIFQLRFNHSVLLIFFTGSQS